MIRTGIAVSVWESEGDSVIKTALGLIFPAETDDDGEAVESYDSLDDRTLHELGL